MLLRNVTLSERPIGGLESWSKLAFNYSNIVVGWPLNDFTQPRVVNGSECSAAGHVVNVMKQ